MALSFPYTIESFQDKFDVKRVSFQLNDNDTFSGLGSGQMLGISLMPKLFTAEVMLTDMYHAQAMQMQARIEALDGVLRKFRLYNTLTPYPQADPDGSILGGSTIVQLHSFNDNRHAIRLKGLPVGYKLTIGDMIGFTFATDRRMLIRVVEDTVADGFGVTPQFEIRPHLRPGVAIDDVMELRKPSGLFMMVPKSFQISTNDDLVTSSLSFQAMQTIR